MAKVSKLRILVGKDPGRKTQGNGNFPEGKREKAPFWLTEVELESSGYTLERAEKENPSLRTDMMFSQYIMHRHVLLVEISVDELGTSLSLPSALPLPSSVSPSYLPCPPPPSKQRLGSGRAGLQDPVHCHPQSVPVAEPALYDC